MKVTLFATCLVDMFETNVGKATVELLEHLGCEVDFPKEQVCCGQPSYNSGYVKESKEAMKKMIKAFENAVYVVCPSGSCAYMFKEYAAIFKGDEIWESRAAALSGKTYELTDFIVNVLGVNEVGASLEGKATYHASCHMTRLLGVRKAPITLLENVQGLIYIELSNKHQCCGFGGTFSVKMSQISGEMVEEKVQHIIDTDADYIIGADAGCLLNIRGRINRLGIPVKVMHIAEVLNNRPQKKAEVN